MNGLGARGQDTQPKAARPSLPMRFDPRLSVKLSSSGASPNFARAIAPEVWGKSNNSSRTVKEGPFKRVACLFSVVFHCGGHIAASKLRIPHHFTQPSQLIAVGLGRVTAYGKIICPQRCQRRKALCGTNLLTSWVSSLLRLTCFLVLLASFHLSSLD